MSLFYAMFTTRIEYAFSALLCMLMVQAMLVGLGMMFKRSVTPLPLIEMMCAPVIQWLTKRLNRQERSGFALVVRGVITFSILYALILGGVYIIDRILSRTISTAFLFEYPMFGMVLGAWPLLFVLSPLTMLPVVYKVSKDNKGQNIHRYLALSLRQNLVQTDDYGLRREGAKAMAYALMDWCIVPLLVYSLLGVQLFYFYVAVSLFCRVVNTPTSPFQMVFQKIYAIVKTIIGYVIFPFIVLASMLSAGAHPLKILKSIGYGKDITMAAFAYGEDCVLGGSYQNWLGDKVTMPWVGPDGASAKLDHKAVIRMIILYLTSLFVFLVMMFVLSAYI